MELTIECKTRPADSKPNALRRSGHIPAVLYGHSGTESVALTVEAKAAELLIRDASINNTLITVNVPDIAWSGKALMREVQTHPWKRYVYHISFFSVSSHASLEVVVPLQCVGTAAGVKAGGSLDPLMNNMSVKCSPDNIPERIEVDVTNMNVGDSIHVNELSLPEGVTPTTDGTQIVVTVLPPAG